MRSLLLRERARKRSLLLTSLTTKGWLVANSDVNSACVILESLMGMLQGPGLTRRSPGNVAHPPSSMYGLTLSSSSVSLEPQRSAKNTAIIEIKTFISIFCKGIQVLTFDIGESRGKPRQIMKQCGVFSIGAFMTTAFSLLIGSSTAVALRRSTAHRRSPSVSPRSPEEDIKIVNMKHKLLWRCKLTSCCWMAHQLP